MDHDLPAISNQYEHKTMTCCGKNWVLHYDVSQALPVQDMPNAVQQLHVPIVIGRA